MRSALPPLILCALSSVAVAWEPQVQEHPIDLTPGDFPEPGVLFDRPDGPGGALWACGRDYKARFDRDGATFFPFLGSEAPGSHPLKFQLESVALDGVPIRFASDVPAVRDGNDVRFYRGGVTELYAMRAGSMEQMFVFDDLPQAGALTLRLRVAGDLEASQGVDGLTFSNGHGGVNYSAAVAVGARGRRRPAETRSEADLIEIHLPRDVVDQLEFPLVVDPVISSFTVESSSQDDGSSDAVYLGAIDRWCIVWERTFSAVDHDVLTCFVDSNGMVVPGTTATVDITTADWRHPEVAYDRSSEVTMAVAEVGQAPGRDVFARPRMNGSLGNVFQVSSGASTDSINPDIGGHPAPAGLSGFCVVWEDAGSFGGVYSQLVHPNGHTIGSPIYLSSGSGEIRTPSVARSCGSSMARGWNIVWARISGPGDSSGAEIYHIETARIDEFGVPEVTGLTLHSSSEELSNPVVSSSLDAADGDTRFLVAWQADDGVARHLEGLVFRGTTQIAPASGVMDLSALLGADEATDQFDPSVDCDGATFVLGFSEVTSTFPLIDHDVYIASLSLSGVELVVTDGPVGLQASAMVDGQVAVSADRSGGGGRHSFLATWTDGQLDFSGNIGAAFYRTPGAGDSYCIGGLNSVGSRAHISASGSVSLASPGGGITLHVTDCPPNKPGIFFFGDGQLQAPFGEGFRCAGGQVQRVYPFAATDGAGVVQRQIAFGSGPGAALFPGAPGVNYQYWYRDPSGGPNGFNLSDALHVEHTP